MAKSIEAVRLTDQERKFVMLVSKGTKRGDAAKLSGYVADDQDNMGAEILGRSNVQAALAVELGNMLRTRLAPLALKRMDELLESSETADRVKEGLIKAALDRAGFPASRPTSHDGAGDKQLNEMSGDELRRFIDQAESLLASRAKPVESATKAIEGKQASDIFS